MVRFEQITGTNILEFEIDGGFSREDFERLRIKLEEMFAVFGKVRIIEIIRSLGPVEPSAFWEDLKFGPKHMKDFTHAAVVADQHWIKWITLLVKPFISGDVRYFQLSELDEAHQWIASASVGTST